MYKHIRIETHGDLFANLYVITIARTTSRKILYTYIIKRFRYTIRLYIPKLSILNRHVGSHTHTRTVEQYKTSDIVLL